MPRPSKVGERGAVIVFIDVYITSALAFHTLLTCVRLFDGAQRGRAITGAARIPQPSKRSSSDFVRK